MRLITIIRQRWLDWRRERRIKDLATCCSFEAAAGRRALAQEAWDSLVAEILARSPQQQERMQARSLARMDPFDREKFLASVKRHAGSPDA